MKKVRKNNKPSQKHPQKVSPAAPKVSSKKNLFTLAGIASVILLGIIVYSNSFSCSFHFDDFNNIVENGRIRDLSDVKAWAGYSANRPVAFFTFALNYHFSRLDVWYWHLFNLAIHLVVSCLVYWLTMLIMSTPYFKDRKIVAYKKELALFTALLFVSHPLATQSVTYIVQRMSSMVAMFYLFSLALYIKARISDQKIAIKILLYLTALVSAVIAMFTKENAFTLPFAILLVEFFFIRTRRPLINFKDYRVIILAAIFAAALLILPLRMSLHIFDEIPLSINHGRTYTVTWFNYLLTQFSVIPKYIRLLILPVNQVVDYDYPIARSFFEFRTLFGFLFLAGLLALAVYLFRKNRLVSFGIFWFFLTLSIESSIIPITDVIFEHRTYLPSVGFFIILTSVIFLLLREKHRIWAVALLVIIIGTNSYLTYQRNRVWQDELTLWTDNISKAPWCARAYYNRGRAYAGVQDWEKAWKDCSKAIELNPGYMLPYFGRADANESLSRHEEAIADYTKTVGFDSAYLFAYMKRGIIYMKLQDWNNAIRDFSKVIQLNPAYTDAFSDRAVAYMNLKDYANARNDLSEVISRDPGNASAYNNRGIALRNLKETDLALNDFTNAIAIDPNYTNAYLNRANTYLSIQRWDLAVKDYSEVIKQNPGVKDAWVNREYALRFLPAQKN